MLDVSVLPMRPVAADIAALPLPLGRFDRVLFDAPCSGTGTLRKNPEIRYRVTPEAIERLAKAQEAELAAAAALLAPGGFLLYSTCSLELEENERVVERVCAASPGLSPAAIAAPPALSPFVDGARFRLFPDERVDGFTAHLLRRRRAGGRAPGSVNRSWLGGRLRSRSSCAWAPLPRGRVRRIVRTVRRRTRRPFARSS